MNINSQENGEFCEINQGENNGEEKINDKKRDFLKITAAASGACCGIYALGKAVNYMAVSEDSKAEATAEVDISGLKPGESMTTVWRGKPIFIRNRTEEEIKEAIADNREVLRDAQSDEARTKPGKENILVVIGICTHLGCVPIGKSKVYNGGEFGGWFCPCHGSHYDISGRIRKGPAPLNLEVPPYKFISETKILIGET